MKGKLWFIRKRFGWGWTPVTWQGWGVLAIYLGGVFLLSRFIQMYAPNDTVALTFFLPILIILTVLLLLICYATGEEPKWQWGFKRDSDHGADKN